MFFNRNNRHEPSPTARVGLSDGVESKIAAFVKDWGAGQRGGRKASRDSKESPLQLLTDADLALFVEAMEDEAAKIEAELQDLNQRRLAEIAQKDAQIAAINREIESQQARIRNQSDEIDRRVGVRLKLLETVAVLDPHLVTDNLSAHEIRSAVVRKQLGNDAVAGRTEDYVEARFDIIASSVKVDPFSKVVADGLVPAARGDGKAEADKAYADHCESLRDAYKTKH